MSSFSYINNESGIKMYDRIKIIILYNDYIAIDLHSQRKCNKEIKREKRRYWKK